MKFSRLERLYKKPKEMKASLSKVQAFKFILQNADSKLRLFQTSIFKFYLLSPISALLLPTCSTSRFQNLGIFFFSEGVWRPFRKMVNIFAYTCPNRSGVGAINNPDRSEQVFDAYYISKASKKIFMDDISMVRP